MATILAWYGTPPSHIVYHGRQTRLRRRARRDEAVSELRERQGDRVACGTDREPYTPSRQARHTPNDRHGALAVRLGELPHPTARADALALEGGASCFHDALLDTARKDVPCRVCVSIRLEPTRRTGMFTNPQRLLRRNATGRALLGRPSRVNRDEVRPFTFALVFEHPQERPPRRACSIPGIAGEFDQALRVQILDRHQVVLGGVVVRQLVEEVSSLPFQVGVAFGHDLPLFFPIRRAVFLP